MKKIHKHIKQSRNSDRYYLIIKKSKIIRIPPTTTRRKNKGIKRGREMGEKLLIYTNIIIINLGRFFLKFYYCLLLFSAQNNSKILQI